SPRSRSGARSLCALRYRTLPPQPLFASRMASAGSGGFHSFSDCQPVSRRPSEHGGQNGFSHLSPSLVADLAAGILGPVRDGGAGGLLATAVSTDLPVLGLGIDCPRKALAGRFWYWPAGLEPSGTLVHDGRVVPGPDCGHGEVCRNWAFDDCAGPVCLFRADFPAVRLEPHYGRASVALGRGP